MIRSPIHLRSSLDPVPTAGCRVREGKRVQETIQWGSLIGLAAAVFLGASTQRISGMGFAMVASPFIVMVLGPYYGVMLVNVLGGASALLIFIQVLKQIEYKKVLLLLIPAMIMTLPGAWVAHRLSGPWLSIGISIMVVLALLSSFLVRNLPAAGGKGLAIGAGAASGFLSVTAGVSGPPVAAYAVASRWPQAQFSISIQMHFMVLACTSLIAKGGLPGLSLAQWITCAVALVCGILLGNFLAPKIPAKASRAFVVIIAFVGAFTLMGNGIRELL